MKQHGSHDARVSAWLSTEINLPDEAAQLEAIWLRVRDVIAPDLSQKRSAFKAYLERLGLDRHTLLGDVGYSGSLQALLSWISELPLDGHYIISTSEQKTMRPEYTGKLSALFPKVGRLSGGNPLLDHSLVLEIMMSANHGQIDDIELTENFERCCVALRPKRAGTICLSGFSDTPDSSYRLYNPDLKRRSRIARGPRTCLLAAVIYDTVTWNA